MGPVWSRFDQACGKNSDATPPSRGSGRTPGPSGPAVAERILETGYDGPVLFLSGYSEEAVTHEGRLHPKAHFLGKPFTPDTLAKAVRHALDGRRRTGRGTGA